MSSESSRGSWGVAWAGIESVESKSTVVMEERRIGEEEAIIEAAKQLSKATKAIQYVECRVEEYK